MKGSAEEGENLRYSAYVYMYVAGGFKDPTTQFECNLERICIRQDESWSYLTDVSTIKTRSLPRQDVAEDINFF